MIGVGRYGYGLYEDPERVIAPLEVVAELARDSVTREWVLERIRRGDPGPAFIEGGEITTALSELEDERRRLVFMLHERAWWLADGAEPIEQLQALRLLRPDPFGRAR